MHDKQDTYTDSDSARRSDLRTLDRHASAGEVYAALGCLYPGTDDYALDGERRPLDDYGNVHKPSVRGSSKVRDSRAEETGGQAPVSSSTDGIKLPFASSGCAVRRRAWVSGFESAEHDRQNSGDTSMKSASHPDHDDATEQHRPMTDGGIERADADATADTDAGDEDPHFPVGARVEDRDADDPNLAVVIGRPEEPAYARTIDALDGNPSVADFNPDYPASCAVATVAYAGDLDRALDVWRAADPAALARICEDHDVRMYDFPVERLRVVDS